MTFKPENINKKSNLEKKDSLSKYLNFVAQQNHHAYEAFYMLLKEVKPTRILEIGTAQGGFTQFLKHICDGLGLKTTIRTYDVRHKKTYQHMIENGIDVRVENIFNKGYTKLENKEVINFIQDDGTTLVLCDGGKKINEFNILSEYLKESDIIMAHDYAYDRKTFIEEIKSIYWNWHEISESDIINSANKYNLQPYMSDMFKNAVWVCKIKANN